MQPIPNILTERGIGYRFVDFRREKTGEAAAPAPQDG
jgi:hypothetical protein